MVTTVQHDCRNFATEHRATRERPYHFTECGLPNVYLVGVRYFVCGDCGDLTVEIPAAEDLLRRIASHLVLQRYPLPGSGIRFLRKRMNLKARDFARAIGVTPEQVSRWESDANAPTPTADRLLRLIFAAQSGDRDLRAAILDHVTEFLTTIAPAATPSDITLWRTNDNHWSTEDAA